MVTHMVLLQWLTRVWWSSSLWGRTVMSSRVLGRAQNSRLAGSTRGLVQLARLMRPIGFFERENKTLAFIIYLLNPQNNKIKDTHLKKQTFWVVLRTGL